MRRAIAIACLATALGPLLAAAQTPMADKAGTPGPPDDTTLGRNVESMVKAWGDLGWFSGAVLVARGDRVVARTAAGLAQPELKVANAPDTRFRIAGLTQLFTSAAVLKLQEQGRLKVEDPLGRHMTAWPDAYKSLTIEQLLINRSGMKDVSQLPEFVRTIAVPRTLEDLVSTIVAEPVTGTPGQPGGSTNSNFHLLAAVIEKVSGMPYHEFLRREFFEPLGLRNTGYDDPSAIVEKRAAGLSRTGALVTNAPWFHMSNAIGSADLSSTVDDVHTFLRAVAANRILSAASVERMTNVPPPSSTNGAAPAAPSTGYGLRVVPGPPVSWTHQGFINGGVSNLQYFPEAATTILLLSNMTGAVEVSVIARHIARVAAGGAPYLPVRRTGTTPRAEDIALAVGTWDIPGAIVIGPSGVRQPLQLIVRQDGERVLVRQTGSREAAWLSDAPGRLFNPTADQQIAVDPSTPDQITYMNFGGSLKLKRTGGRQ